jgi:hypothetical protein
LPPEVSVAKVSWDFPFIESWEPMSLVAIIYWISIGLNGILCRKLLPYRHDYPAFFAYVIFNAVKTIPLFATFSYPVLYREIFVWSDIIVWALKGLVVGEVLQKVYGFKVAPQLARMGGFLPAYSLTQLNFPLERALGFGLAAVLALLSVCKKDIPMKSYWIIVGLGAYHALSGISAVEVRVWPSLLTWVPTVAYTGVLILWIRVFRRTA